MSPGAWETQDPYIRAIAKKTKGRRAMMRVCASTEKTGFGKLGSARTLIAESVCFLWIEVGCHAFALYFAHESN